MNTSGLLVVALTAVVLSGVACTATMPSSNPSLPSFGGPPAPPPAAASFDGASESAQLGRSLLAAVETASTPEAWTSLARRLGDETVLSALDPAPERFALSENGLGAWRVLDAWEKRVSALGDASGRDALWSLAGLASWLGDDQRAAVLLDVVGRLPEWPASAAAFLRAQSVAGHANTTLVVRACWSSRSPQALDVLAGLLVDPTRGQGDVRSWLLVGFLSHRVEPAVAELGRRVAEDRNLSPERLAALSEVLLAEPGDAWLRTLETPPACSALDALPASAAAPLLAIAKRALASPAVTGDLRARLEERLPRLRRGS